METNAGPMGQGLPNMALSSETRSTVPVWQIPQGTPQGQAPKGMIDITIPSGENPNKIRNMIMTLPEADASNIAQQLTSQGNMVRLGERLQHQDGYTLIKLHVHAPGGGLLSSSTSASTTVSSTSSSAGLSSSQASPPQSMPGGVPSGPQQGSNVDAAFPPISADALAAWGIPPLMSSKPIWRSSVLDMILYRRS